MKYLFNSWERQYTIAAGIIEIIYVLSEDKMMMKRYSNNLFIFMTFK